MLTMSWHCTRNLRKNTGFKNPVRNNMAIAEATESEIINCKYYREEIGLRTLVLTFKNFNASQKLIYFFRNLCDIYENVNNISACKPMILIVLLVFEDEDEFSQKRAVFAVFQNVVDPMKWKKMTRINKDVDLEYSISEIGKSILLLLCVFKTLKNFTSCDKLDCRKTEAVVIELPLLKAIISETIYDILVSPGADENCKMFNHSLFKIRLNRMDSLMSPKDSLKKLRTKRSNPKVNKKGLLSDFNEFILVVLGWSGDKAEESIEIFDVSSQKWSFYERGVRYLRAYHGVAVLDHELYIIGGYNGLTTLPTTVCLNLRSRRWYRKSNMSIARCYVFTLTYNGSIYIFGGHSGSNRLKSCEKYDPKKNAWNRISDMIYRRSDASGAELNGRIFVSGGFDGFQFHFTTEMYDPEYDDWTLIGNLNIPRSGHKMVNFDGQLFVLGGFNGYRRLEEVEIYNEETDEWEEFVPLRTGRSNFCCVVFKQEMYAMGGYNGVTTIDNVEIFNRNLMYWQEAPSLNVHRSATEACVMNNSINVATCDLVDYVPVVLTDIEGSSP